MLFDQSDVRNICTDCCGQSERQPPLILQASAVQAASRQMVSYLIVRLDMQYFHMAFHTAVTSLEASDMPEKNVHGTKWKFQKKVLKNTKLQQLPVKEPEEVQSVLTPFSTTNYTPHPSLSIEKPQRSSFFCC